MHHVRRRGRHGRVADSSSCGSSHDWIDHREARGAEVIVLACTEFGMVVQARDSPVPVIDTTIAHA